LAAKPALRLEAHEKASPVIFLSFFMLLEDIIFFFEGQSTKAILF
jgi:hypothetical protein